MSIYNTSLLFCDKKNLKYNRLTAFTAEQLEVSGPTSARKYLGAENLRAGSRGFRL